MPFWLHHQILHKGHSITKLQNGIILLILKIWKIHNTGFVRDSILSNIYEFYYEGITVTWPVCCFDDWSSDRSSSVFHTVWPACVIV